MGRQDRHRQHARVREATPARYGAAPAPPGALSGVLLDSDVIIDVLRGRPTIVEPLRALERSGAITYCSAISWAEVYAGLRPGEAAATETFFQARRDAVIDAEVGRRAGSYLSRYARTHGLELGDALIAAVASTTGLRLWTLNRRHYPMSDVAFVSFPPAAKGSG